MTHPDLPPRTARAGAESARQRTDRAEAIKKAWQDGLPPDAAAALRADPDIAADRAVALDLAYEEFCTREEAGEVLDPVAFCANFSFGASLRRLLAVHQFLDDHPDALGGAPTRWPAAGEGVGDFLVLRELGRGSFARVYLAVETTAGDRPVALKVSAAGSREADTLGPLSHPHLIPVLSSRAAGPWTAVAMPFVGTATLEDVLSAAWPPGRAAPPSAAVVLEAAAGGGRAEDPPFPGRPAFPLHARMTYTDAVAAVAVGLLSAVAHLHDRGIAHRDIKPSNVLVGPTGHPYLLDFNLASRTADPWRMAGTLPYLAPEQLGPLADARTPAPADGRPGDVFACGVVLFELLTGRHPFGVPAAGPAPIGRDRAAAALLGAQRAGHTALGALNPLVPEPIRAAVERCLALDPRARPTAAELVGLFAPPEPVRPRRSPVSVLVAAGVLALVLSYAASGTPVSPVSPPAPALGPVHPFERGIERYRQGEYEQAARHFTAAGKADNDGRAFGYAAYCLSAKRHYEEAIEAANLALRLNYKTAPVYANRAYNHLLLGHLDQANADCVVALELDANLLAPRCTRAAACLQMSLNKETALPPEVAADLDRVAAAEPNDPDLWLTLAQLYVLSGRPDAAVRAVRNAIATGKPPRAVQRNVLLNRALADQPDFAAALKPSPGQEAPPSDPLNNPHLACPIPR